MADQRAYDPGDRARQARLRMTSFDSFYRFYRPRLVRFLKSRASNTSWAEDVGADAMMAALDRWDDLLLMHRPDSWLFKVAMQKLRNLEAQARDLDYLHDDPASSEADLRRSAATDQ